MVLAQLAEAAETATLHALDGGDPAPALDECAAFAAHLAACGEPLPPLLAETAPVLYACTTIAERAPGLAARCRAVWAACCGAIEAHPTARRAHDLADRVRAAGWRYRELAAAAAALGARDGVPAATILELALGAAPLPFGPSDDCERGSGRTGYAATAIETAVAAIGLLELSAGDTFYDLGAGLGLPVCIAALASDAACRGIEYHAAYTARATANARRLGLHRARFVTGDATTCDFSDGTAFYLFNPFAPDVLHQIAERLLALRRPIRVACHHVALPGAFRAVNTAGPLRLYTTSH